MRSRSIPVTRAVGTAQLAQDFWAAGAAQDHDKSPPSLVTYFLYGHALELAFKALLIVHGISEGELRGIGHDLNQARNAAVSVVPARSNPMDLQDAARIDLLAAYYEAKALEYVEIGFMRLPLLPELRDTTKKLVDAAVDYVERSVRDRLHQEGAV